MSRGRRGWRAAVSSIRLLFVRLVAEQSRSEQIRAERVIVRRLKSACRAAEAAFACVCFFVFLEAEGGEQNDRRLYLFSLNASLFWRPVSGAVPKYFAWVAFLRCFLLAAARGIAWDGVVVVVSAEDVLFGEIQSLP